MSESYAAIILLVFREVELIVLIGIKQQNNRDPHIGIESVRGWNKQIT